MEQLWGRLGVTLGAVSAYEGGFASLLGRFGVVLGVVEVTLGHFGPTLEQLWDTPEHFWVPLGHFGLTLAFNNAHACLQHGTCGVFFANFDHFYTPFCVNYMLKS